jgi:hypothetical protein
MPGGIETWPRERHQRNAIKRGLSDASPDDAGAKKGDKLTRSQRRRDGIDDADGPVATRF